MCRVWRRSSSREVRLVGSRLTSLGDVGGSGRPPYCTCSKAFSPPRPQTRLLYQSSPRFGSGHIFENLYYLKDWIFSLLNFKQTQLCLAKGFSL